MFSKLKQFKDLRDKAKKIQGVLKDIAVEGLGGWGKVKVKMNGSQEVTAVTVDPELLGADNKTKLEGAMKDAMNDAVKKAQREMAEEMRKSGDLKLPGLS